MGIRERIGRGRTGRRREGSSSDGSWVRLVVRVVNARKGARSGGAVRAGAPEQLGPRRAALAAGGLVVLAAPLLPAGPGAPRLLAALGIYAPAFLAAWLVAPGGIEAAHGLARVVRAAREG